MNKNVFTSGLLLGLTVMLAACGNDKATTDTDPQATAQASTNPVLFESKAPVKLIVFTTSTYEKFMEENGGALIQKKYPNFSFEVITSDKDIYQKMAADNTKVDIVFQTFTILNSNVKPFGLLADMSDLVKKFNFDLKRIETPYLDMIRNLDDGKLSALPFSDNRMILYYNKDLFDRFGVAYPKDGMTWDETYEIAKRMTRTDGGVQYRGFAANPVALMIMNQNSLNFSDSKTQKAQLNTDPWKQYIQTFLPFYSMSGYSPAGSKVNAAALKVYTKDNTTAMTVLFNSNAADQETRMNWDAVSLPEMKGKQGIGSYPYPSYLSVASTSQHRNEAFAAVSELLSDDVQMQLSKQFAIVSPLVSPQVKAAFAKDVVVWQGKNLNAVTSQKPAPAPTFFGKYDDVGLTEVTNAMISVIAGEKDLNTALRDSEESVNKKIGEQESARK